MPLFTDDFNRADTFFDLGANWTPCVGTGLGINSNAAYSSEATVSHGNFVTAVAQANNQYAQGIISGVGSGQYFTFLLRGSGSGATRNCYQFSVGGTDELYIARITAGSNVSQEAGNFTLANGDLIRVEANGSALRLLVNGVQKLTKTDSTHTSGLTGIEIYTGSGSANGIDNFEAGDLGSASAIAAISSARLRMMLNN